MSGGQKIIDGLDDAIAFLDGDTSRGTIVTVSANAGREFADGWVERAMDLPLVPGKSPAFRRGWLARDDVDHIPGEPFVKGRDGM